MAWRPGSQQGISKMATMALGGIFLMTPEPASVGSVLDLIFEVTTGARVRARATVRTSRPGEGMGVKFVHNRLGRSFSAEPLFEDASRCGKY